MKTVARLFLILLTALPLSAGVLFSDNFESGSLSGLNWAATGSAFVTTDPLSGPNGEVLSFSEQGSGCDLFSVLIPYALNVNFSFDFYEPFAAVDGSIGYAGTDHAGFPEDNEEWLWNAASGSPAVTPGVWNHVSFDVQPFDNGGTRPFLVKFESGGSDPGASVPFNVFFDNVVVSDSTPEPSLSVLAGFGLAGLALLRYGRRGASKLEN
jgi:hypothetical protein